MDGRAEHHGKLVNTTTSFMLSLLFERFYQVDGSSSRRFGGMGLGLALCQEIVTRHSGRIWAVSLGEGHGLTVTFSLPVVAS
jgi:signal transduction histidine kinase